MAIGGCDIPNPSMLPSSITPEPVAGSQQQAPHVVSLAQQVGWTGGALGTMDR